MSRKGNAERWCAHRCIGTQDTAPLRAAMLRYATQGAATLCADIIRNAAMACAMPRNTLIQC
eukprot:1097158-Pyramimonas_sp.AAC.1